MNALDIFEMMVRGEGAVPGNLTGLHAAALLAENLAEAAPRLTHDELWRMVAVGALICRQNECELPPNLVASHHLRYRGLTTPPPFYH
ncbi:hypothetical protein QU481_21110 [Crenobacter sp. SG2303]|uniref:Uncharacterized protein n=1 Tax=Crenobacter oryzisoli TaxID=3056844 RepID=A0ABT7XU71_9NEIS|nr:hypothetical protein [Crenobacter sp. SG2303]MDN0077336.1 hypothetical protein [Crenobacter sp. SG2303]